MARRKLTHAEFVAEAAARFGDDPKTYAFVCPNCGDEATVGDFLAAGDPDACMAGQECIGRILGALKKDVKPYAGRGCDWAAYGLFPGPWEIVFPADGDKPEHSVSSFAFAPATQPGYLPMDGDHR